MSEDITLSVGEGIARVTLAREPVNALTHAMFARLTGIFDEISERDDVRVAVLQSACRAFCAGGDLRDRPDGFTPGAILAANRIIRNTFDAIHDCGKPVIAVLSGAAIGAGFIIAAQCDIILAAPDVKIQMPEVTVGFAGGAAVLHSILGKSRARRLFFTGEPILSQELDRLGVLECVPADRLEAEVAALAATIASKSPEAIRYAKRNTNAAELLGTREAYRQEQEYTAILSRSPTALAAQQAALRK